MPARLSDGGPLEQVMASAVADENCRVTLSSVYRLLARVQRELSKPADAVDTLGKYKKLWPTNAARLIDAGCELAECATAVGAAGTPLSAGEEAERQSYLGLAVQALREAVGNRFGDAARLRQEPRLRPLHDHPDFQRLLRELEGKEAPR